MSIFSFFTRACIVMFLFVASVFATTSFPEKPVGFISDMTSTLTPAETSFIATKLETYEKETGNEIAVAIIPSTENMDIAEYATKLGNIWGVGKAKADNGVLVVIAKNDRQIFIATGRQIEGALTDLEGKDIIDSVITPRFKNGDFYNGILAGIDGIIFAINGESFSKLRMSSESDFGGFDFLVFLIVVGGSWLGSILGRSKAIWPGALIGGIGGFLITVFNNIVFFSLTGIAVFVFGSLFGLLFDWMVSRNYQNAQKNGTSPSWWAGGGFKGGGGSGGFGGFSGGSFSGGGSRGSW